MKTCKKCGHAAQYELIEPTSCPQCGAIYAKVEEAMRAAAEGRATARAAVAPPRASPVRDAVSRREAPEVDVHAFAELMRGESLYPAWRKIVGIFTVLGYILAAIFLVAALTAVSKGSATAGAILLCIALVVAIVAKVTKELSLMVADLSDASVRMAAQREAG